MSKANTVESILPLTFMQQTLLMHHLHEGEDQGFLQVICELEGNLQQEIFSRAWNLCLQRHPALRTSIHWDTVPPTLEIIFP